MNAHLTAHTLAISVVSMAELKRGALAAHWGERRIAELEEELRSYIVLPVDSEIAEEWARMRVRCDQLGRRKTDNDLWVAATARRYGVTLATLDRDQLDVPGLRVIGEDAIEVAVPE